MRSSRIAIGWLFILFLAGGCAPHTRPATAPEASPAAPPPLACREVEGLEPLLTPGSGLLLGEIHGTVESPAFLANAVCIALRAGRSVTVALEVPRDERERVDAFLASAGTEADRAALLDSPFWTADYQDGRQSRAMLSLVDELRRLHREGRPLRVKLIDRSDKPPATGVRDRWMAEALAEAFDETPGGVVISLTGDVHSRIRAGTPWDPAYPTAGSVLAGLKPGLRLTALDVGYQGGTAWICMSADARECQAKSLRGRGDATPGRVVLLPEVTDGHHGTYGVGSITASPPAVGPKLPMAPAPPPLACREVEGLEPLLAPGSGLLLGEIHGTVESPAFLANAACIALRAGRSVTVALEVPREEDARVAAFLASAGTDADRAALLDSPFWTADYQDGRRSVAMLSLFDELRRLHREGRPIRVKLLDRAEMPAASVDRDRWMAAALAEAFDEVPNGVVISLTGDVHSRIRPGTPWDPNYETAGSVLVGLKPGLRVTALNVTFQAGTAWTCLSADPASCLARSPRGRGDATPGRVVLLPEVTDGHNGTYGVGSITASPPAVGPRSLDGGDSVPVAI